MIKKCNVQFKNTYKNILNNVFLQTELTEYKYIDKNNEKISLDMAEKMCADENGYHLLSINSHEEQQLLEDYFNKVANFYHINTIYLFISLKKQVQVGFLLCIKVNSNRILLYL